MDKTQMQNGDSNTKQNSVTSPDPSHAKSNNGYQLHNQGTKQQPAAPPVPPMYNSSYRAAMQAGGKIVDPVQNSQVKTPDSMQNKPNYGQAMGNLQRNDMPSPEQINFNAGAYRPGDPLRPKVSDMDMAPKSQRNTAADINKPYSGNSTRNATRFDEYNNFSARNNLAKNDDRDYYQKMSEKKEQQIKASATTAAVIATVLGIVVAGLGYYAKANIIVVLATVVLSFVTLIKSRLVKSLMPFVYLGNIGFAVYMFVSNYWDEEQIKFVIEDSSQLVPLIIYIVAALITLNLFYFNTSLGNYYSKKVYEKQQQIL